MATRSNTNFLAYFTSLPYFETHACCYALYRLHFLRAKIFNSERIFSFSLCEIVHKKSLTSSLPQSYSNFSLYLTPVFQVFVFSLPNSLCIGQSGVKLFLVTTLQSFFLFFCFCFPSLHKRTSVIQKGSFYLYRMKTMTLLKLAEYV